MKPALPALLLALLLLYGFPPAASAPTPSQIQVGYSPFHLYSSDLGTPVYLPGESIWVYASSPALFSLTDPSGAVSASGDFTDTPLRLYTFARTDHEGAWTLSVSSVGAQANESLRSFQVSLVNPGLDVAQGRPSFELAQNDLVISGNLSLAQKTDFPSTVLLTRAQSGYTTVVNTDFKVGSGDILVKASYSVSDGEITLYPFLSANSTSETAVFWAHLSLGVPLVKKVNAASSVVNVVQDTALASPKVSAVLGSSPTTSVSIAVPPPASGGLGQFPLRYGRSDILLNVEIGSTIYVVRIPFFILPNGNGMDVVGVQQSEAGTSIPFTFKDGAPGTGKYDIFVFSERDGVDLVWNGSITAPLSRVVLKNDLLDQNVTDFGLSISGVQGTKIGDGFYAIPTEGSAAVSYRATFNGMPLTPQDVSPGSLLILPGTTEVLHMRAGFVSFDVENSTGSIVGDGTVAISRMINDTPRSVTTLQLVPAQANAIDGTGFSFPVATLPLGDYRATVVTAGQNQTQLFKVQNSSSLVKIVLPAQSGRAGQSIGEAAPLISALTVVIAAESFLAYRVWKNVLRGPRRSR